MKSSAMLLPCLVLALGLGPVPTRALEPVPDKLVVLTFDDSVRSHHAVVRPMLKQYGFGATFFITEGFSFRTNKQDYMTWEQIAELHRDGFEIGNHTRDHLGVSSSTLGQLREQLEAINARCAQQGIPRPVSFGYPGNAIAPGALPILKELGVRFARRGGAPEHPYDRGRGFAYEPGADHPLLIPSAGDARPDWTLDDFKRAVDQARAGRIAVLQFHGVPDVEHPWVHTRPERFEVFMRHLKTNAFKVIALRDLSRYVDLEQVPADPFAIIEERKAGRKEVPVEGEVAGVGNRLPPPTRNDVRSATPALVDPALDWPAWRGPAANGIAASGQNPPVQWSETEGILWKTAIPGRGHGSPTVVGDRIYLATADRVNQTQSVLCLDRHTGKQVWQTEVHGGQADPGKHSNSSAASSTVAVGGERLFINFLNGGAVHTTALDLAGHVVWQRKICDFVTHQGFASSPVVHESLVLVSADHKGGGVIAGLDRQTGRMVWSESRPKLPNYTSPAIVQAGGRTQMVLAGCNRITSLDPLTGQKLWEVDGSTEECVGTAVTDGVRVFVSGGYPRNHTVAIVADGSGTIAWQNNTRIYVPSMIAKAGHLYAVMDAGMAVCWKSDTGEELWKERLGGDFFASPVRVDDRIYASNVGGRTFVFEATPQGFKLLAQNQLGDEAYASPVICAGRIYLRVAQRGENRQEFLYCIGHRGRSGPASN